MIFRAFNLNDHYLINQFSKRENGERFYFVFALLIQTLRANFESREVNALHIDDKKITNRKFGKPFRFFSSFSFLFLELIYLDVHKYSVLR